MALSLRHVADQLFSEVRVAKEKHGFCEYSELDHIGCLVHVHVHMHTGSACKL